MAKGTSRRKGDAVRSIGRRQHEGPLRPPRAVAHAVCLCATAFFLAFLPSLARAASLEEAEALAASAAETYERASSYRIEFVQESYWALADSTQVTEGVLLASSPSSISIRYADGGRISVDGESLWVYVPQTNQFFSSAMDTADVAVDPGRLLRLYTPDPTEPFVDSADGATTLLLRPLNAIAEPSRLTVTIDRERLVVTEMVAFALSGDRTTYRIVDTSFGVSIGPAEFRPRRPAGSELIRGSTPGTP